MEQFYHESFRTTKQFPMQLRLHQGVINYAVLEHWHRSMEIDYLIDCEVQLMVSGKKTLVQSEEIILINSGDIHALWPERKIGRTQDELFGASIFISYEFLKEICPQFDEVCFVLEGNEEKKEELKHDRDLQKGTGGVHLSENDGAALPDAVPSFYIFQTGEESGNHKKPEIYGTNTEGYELCGRALSGTGDTLPGCRSFQSFHGISCPGF